MEPEIQYCTTSDGVSIAYHVIGRGPAIVAVSGISASHLSAVWRIPEIRSAMQALAEDFTVVRYDGRGSGLSQREPADFSLEARLLDLEAVVCSTKVSGFALLASLNAGMTAIAYAAQNPDRISGLVLLNVYANGERFYQESPLGRFVAALREVTEEQWEFVTLAWANRIFQGADSGLAATGADLLRAAMTPQAALKFRDSNRQIDVTSLLKEVSAPTLVVHQEGGPTPLSFTQALASGIPKARLVVSRGLGLAEPDVMRAIKSFLGAASLAPPPVAGVVEAPAGIPSGTAIILFADIADSTGLTERLGDAAFREKARELDGALRGVIRDNGGTPIEGKLLGDGVLAVFTSARQAIEAALRCGKAGEEAGLPLHLGLHAGDVIREEGNVYGGAVNVTARISGLSAPGEVLVSDTVRSLARTSAGVRFEDRGERELKGVGEAVRVWAVREGE